MIDVGRSQVAPYALFCVGIVSALSALYRSVQIERLLAESHDLSEPPVELMQPLVMSVPGSRTFTVTCPAAPELNAPREGLAARIWAPV